MTTRRRRHAAGFAAMAAGVLMFAASLGIWLTGAAAAPFAQPKKKTTGEGVYTEAQALRGEKLYRQKCSFCHRDNLQGNSVDGGPPLRGNTFTSAWQNIALSSLFTTVQELMPPDNPGTLTEQQAVDVMTFILWANGAPPGAAELPADPSMLENITVTTPEAPAAR